MGDSRKARPFKTNVFDRTVLLNNTFVVRGRYAQTRADILLRSFARNNLWIFEYDNPDEATNPTGALLVGSSDELKPGEFTSGGQTAAEWNTDVDFNGYSWKGEKLGQFPFWWNGAKPERFRSLTGLAETIGIERNGIQFDYSKGLEIDDLAGYAASAWSMERLQLRNDSTAIDAGVVVPNLCEIFEGESPDFGAHEFGAAPVHYGPRPKHGRE